MTTRKVKDITGQRSGKLTAKKHVGFTKHRNALWECVCACGSVTTVAQGHISRGETKSCGCSRRASADKDMVLPPGEAGFNYLLRQYRYSAKRRSVLFTLAKSEFRVLTTSNCFYCGEAPSNTICNSGDSYKHSEFTYNGIDRINSSEGYIKSNCIPCCKKCNYAKGTLSIDVFIELANRISKHTGRGGEK